VTSSISDLSPLRVGLSISAGEDPAGAGPAADAVNRAVRTISESLLASGARLVFGHDWRPDGVMQEIYQFAAGLPSSAARDKSESAPLLTNVVAWPQRSEIATDERERLLPILEIVETPLPPPFRPSEAEAARDPSLHAFLQVAALTAMRHDLVARTDARLCLGGRVTGSLGRFAGVIEEAYLTVQRGRPLYLSGLFGGASREIIRALRSQPYDPDAFLPRADVAAALHSFHSRFGERPEVDTLTGSAIANRFSDLGVAGLCRLNGLNEGDNLRLFDATSIDEILTLLRTGLPHIQPQR
jgi:hypothetical protein